MARLVPVCLFVRACNSALRAACALLSQGASKGFDSEYEACCSELPAFASREGTAAEFLAQTMICSCEGSPLGSFLHRHGHVLFNSLHAHSTC